MDKSAFGRLRQLRDQSEGNGQFVELEVRAQEGNGAIAAGAARYFRHLYARFAQRELGLLLLAGVVVEQHVLRQPAVQVVLDDNASQDQKAQFPLREASVQVSEVPGRPGVYRAVSFLRPHFQLDELSVSLRLVAELPQSTNG